MLATVESPVPLAELLERAGEFPAGALEPFVRESAATGRPLARLLAERFGAEALAALFARVSGWPRLDPAALSPSPAALALVDRAWVDANLAVPLGFEPRTGALAVAVADPSRRAALDALAAGLGRALAPGVVGLDDLDRLAAGLPEPAPDPVTRTLASLRPLFDGQQDAVRSLHAIFELCVARGVITREEYLARLASAPD
jgi:hypothetical protein